MEAIEHYKKGLERNKSTSRSKASVGKDEKKALSKNVSQKRGATSKDRSVEQKRKAPTVSTARENEVETHKDETQESQKNAEVTDVPPAEVHCNVLHLSYKDRKSN